MGDQGNQDDEVRIPNRPMTKVQAKEFKDSLQVFVHAIQEEVGAPKIFKGMTIERGKGCTFIQVTKDNQNAKIEELDSEQPCPQLHHQLHLRSLAIGRDCLTREELQLAVGF